MACPLVAPILPLWYSDFIFPLAISPNMLLFSAGNTAHNKALKIECSQALIVKARPTGSRTSDHIKRLLRTLEWLELSDRGRHATLRLLCLHLAPPHPQAEPQRGARLCRVSPWWPARCLAPGVLSLNACTVSVWSLSCYINTSARCAGLLKYYDTQSSSLRSSNPSLSKHQNCSGSSESTYFQALSPEILIW